MKEAILWVLIIIVSFILLNVLYFGAKTFLETEQIIEKGVVTSVGPTKDGCYCLTVFSRSYRASDYFWHLCPEETAVGDSISITVIKTTE